MRSTSLDIVRAPVGQNDVSLASAVIRFCQKLVHKHPLLKMICFRNSKCVFAPHVKKGEKITLCTDVFFDFFFLCKHVCVCMRVMERESVCGCVFMLFMAARI